MHRDIRDDLILWVTLIVGAFACCALVADEPMTLEQYETGKQLEQARAAGELTFEYDLTQIGKYSTGYVPKTPSIVEPARMGDGEKLRSFSLKDFGRELNPVLNQGSCGSCVIFAFTAVAMDLFKIRDMPIDHISMQHYMNCSSGGQCNGAYGEEIADDAVRLGRTGGFYKLSDYPYIARSGRCQVKEGREKVGIIKSWKTIDGSVKSMLAALKNGQGVAVGIAANGALQSYRSGVFSCNVINSHSINHYVYLEGIDCETSVDADGFCKFDEDGNLPNGVGIFTIRNSWGKNWGEAGYVRMKMTNRNGSRCNGVAAYKGDAQILDNGFPVPPPGPVEFEVNSKQAKLRVTLKDGKYRKSDLEPRLKNALDALGEK